ncbi:kinase-like protein [Ceratobasidium sp. AG-I]|nr:kinase-like protein [Ceratobasidium sp. AG-I]
MSSRSPDDMFCGVPNLTHSVKIVDTCAFAHGGFSDIWKGVEYDIECSGVVLRNVAIKVIRVVTQEQTGLERLKTRISREVASWCSVSHKNIIPFYGLCWLPGSSNIILPSMVYPYCPAGTCAAYIKNNPTADKMNIIRQVADGLVCLHSQPKPIVHGDIKASNVLMQEDGTPMLADFGLSRVVMEISTGWTTSSSMGSYRWMAPQLLGGAEDETMVPVTVESDVWAFGCLCIEILTRCVPWGNIKNDINVIRAVSSGQRPPLPSDLRSATLGHILQHCWAYEPADRPITSQLSSALYNVSLSAYTPHCALCPPKGIPSGPPTALVNRDVGTSMQTCDLSIFGEGDESLVLRTKTHVALWPIGLILLSLPLSTPSNPHLPSEPQAPVTLASSNESTTPCVELVALTPGSQSSLGSAPQERLSVFGYLTRPVSTHLPDIGSQSYAERIQKYRRVNNKSAQSKLRPAPDDARLFVWSVVGALAN